MLPAMINALREDIQPDAARLEAEIMRDMVREERARMSVNASMESKEKATILRKKMKIINMHHIYS